MGVCDKFPEDFAICSLALFPMQKNNSATGRLPREISLENTLAACMGSHPSEPPGWDGMGWDGIRWPPTGGNFSCGLLVSVLSVALECSPRIKTTWLPTCASICTVSLYQLLCSVQVVSIVYAPISLVSFSHLKQHDEKCGV